MAWKIEFDDGIEKALKRLSLVNRARVIRYLEDRVATGNPRSLGQAMQGDFAGLWRYRVGDYRVVAKIIDQRLVILVVDVDHRSAVYR